MNMVGTIATKIAIPVLTNMATNFLGSLFEGGKKNQSVQPMQTMQNFTQTMPIAQSMVNNLYDNQLKQTMQNMDYQNMQRGFYGQLPGDVLRNARAFDVEQARASHIANLATQLQGQGFQQGLAQQQMNLAQQQAGQGNLTNWANLALQGMFGFHDREGQWPWEKNVMDEEGEGTVKKSKEMAKNLNLQNSGSLAGTTKNYIY